MKKKKIFTLLIFCFLVAISPLNIFSMTAEAITASEIIAQVQATRKHIEQLSGRTDFTGYCGAHVSYQLKSVGITSSVVGKDGKDHYDAYKNQTKSSGGYPVLLFPASQSDLGETLNLLTRNGTVDAFNILVGFERGSTDSDGQKFGHVVFIHGIIDGIVYYIESYSTKIDSKYYKEGEVISCSISQFTDYYKKECTLYDGIVYFGHPYMKSCTPSNVCGSLKIKSATSARALPCKLADNSDSKSIVSLSVGQEYEYVKKYKNASGESWYQIKCSDGLLFVQSENIEIVSSQTPENSFTLENIQVDTFYISNGSYYLNMLADRTGTQTVSVSNSNVGTTNQFKLERLSSDSITYKIKSVSSSGGYVLDCRWQNQKFTSNGDEVILNQVNDDLDLSQAWCFEKFEEGYLIHVAGTPSLVLTREGNEVVVKKNTKASNQIWKLSTESVCNHDFVYKANDEMHWQQCRLCSYIDGVSTHQYTNWEIELAPTCTEVGVKKSNCDVCHAEKVDFVGVLDHEYVTEIADGYRHFTCTMCGYTYKELIEGNEGGAANPTPGANNNTDSTGMSGCNSNVGTNFPATVSLLFTVAFVFRKRK